MIDLSPAGVPIRAEIEAAIEQDLNRLRSPGGSLSGAERVETVRTARSRDNRTEIDRLAALLYHEPARVTGDDIARASQESGYPPVVETIGVVSRIAAIDRFYSVLGLEPPPLPEPREGAPTGEVDSTLKLRRGHVPMPPGPIPVSLDLVPAEGRALIELHSAIYMSPEEMGDPLFRREPGLDTPQLEVVAARVSLLNECFY